MLNRRLTRRAAKGSCQIAWRFLPGWACHWKDTKLEPFAESGLLDRKAPLLRNFPRGADWVSGGCCCTNCLWSKRSRCGVEMLWGARVSAIRDNAVLVNGRAITCRWIIGADGQNSRVRDWADLSAGSGRTQRIGLRQHFKVRSWSDHVEIYWGSYGQAYVTPVGSNEVCVALISRPKFHSFSEGLSQFPELAARLKHAQSSTRAMGALSISRQLKQVCRGNVALVGEASGSVDAITGEGMALAFRQALALAPALAAGDLSSYAAAHSKINSLPEFMSRSMLLMDRSRWLRRRSLRALSRQPGLFARMLAVHVGEMRLKDFGASGLLNLGWQLLRA